MSNPGPPNPDPLDITNELDSIAELSASGKFLDLLKEIGNAPNDDRSKVATKLATVDEMKKRGIPVTPETRLTLRYFEERPGKAATNVVTDTPDVDAGGAVVAGDTGWTVCASTGYISEGGVLVCSSLGKKMLQ